jgi:hypothetical protein
MLYLMRTEGVLLIECVTRIERVCVRCGGKGGLSVDLERVVCACGCSEDVMVCVCVCVHARMRRLAAYRCRVQACF